MALDAAKRDPKPSRGQSHVYRVPDITATDANWIVNGFLYPLQGQGLVLLGVGTIVFSVLSFISSVSMFGFIGYFLMFGYLCAFYQNIVQTSADGHGELPNWPDFTDFFSDIVAPFFQILGCFVVCIGPAIAYQLFISQRDFDPLFFVLLIGGALYLPMALLAVSLTESIGSLNPIVLVPSIIKVFVDYAFILILLAISAALSFVCQSVLRASIPILGAILEWFVTLYFATIQFRLIGLLYFRNRDTLDWF